MKRGRNPRRAYDADGREIQPSRIGDMLENGIRHVTAHCRAIGCGHSGRIDVERWPPDMYVPDIDLRLRCSRCGVRRNASIMPDWREKDAEIDRRKRLAREAYGELIESALAETTNAPPGRSRAGRGRIKGRE